MHKYLLSNYFTYFNNCAYLLKCVTKKSPNPKSYIDTYIGIKVNICCDLKFLFFNFILSS